MSEAQRDEVISHGSWQFDQEVTAVFDDMLQRSKFTIPDKMCKSLDGFQEVRESVVLVDDLHSPSKFLEQEYSDYFCLL